MKKRLKKKVMKQLAKKIKQIESNGKRPEPTKLESRIAESIFTSEFKKFQMNEFDQGTIYDYGYLTRMEQKVKEIDDMFKPDNLLKMAKML